LKEEKAQERIDQIIKATLRCIAAEGYGNVTMNAIAKYAGLSKGAINHYFKKKEEILLAALYELDQKLFEAIDTKVRHVTDHKDHLRVRLREYFKLAKEQPALMYVWIDYISIANKNDSYGKRIKKQLAKYRYLSSLGVKPGLEAGIYRQVDPDVIGTILVAVLMGLCLQWIVDKEGFDYEKATKIAEDMLIQYVEK